MEAKKLEHIDPDGDTILRHADDDAPDLLVSSKVLSLSSKVFKTMLNPSKRWKETATDSNGRNQITLHIGSPSNIKLLMQILHHQPYQVELVARAMKQHELSEWAEILEFYDLFDSLMIYTTFWGNHLHWYLAYFESGLESGKRRYAPLLVQNIFLGQTFDDYRIRGDVTFSPSRFFFRGEKPLSAPCYEAIWKKSREILYVLADPYLACDSKTQRGRGPKEHFQFPFKPSGVPEEFTCCRKDLNVTDQLRCEREQRADFEKLSTSVSGLLKVTGLIKSVTVKQIYDEYVQYLDVEYSEEHCRCGPTVSCQRAEHINCGLRGILKRTLAKVDEMLDPMNLEPELTQVPQAL
ncbi:hypothetical protein ABW19_dt0202718 [Dactylella cylindrospora]|nr:hypothetical protein ABW19_dt0202718 [Dactylella cylindrospora]